jgi:sec-independent protein translocase protein TatB
MFDIGWAELLLTAVVALVVIGPKDIPQAMRTVARVIGRLRAMSREVQNGVAEVMREAELDELRRKMEQAKQLDTGGTVQRAVDPDGSLTADFDPAAFARDLRSTVEGVSAARPAPAPEDPSTQVEPPAAAGNPGTGSAGDKP